MFEDREIARGYSAFCSHLIGVNLSVGVKFDEVAPVEGIEVYKGTRTPVCEVDVGGDGGVANLSKIGGAFEVARFCVQPCQVPAIVSEGYANYGER